MGPQSLPKLGREELPGRLQKGLPVRRLGSKGNALHPQPVQNLHTTGGKALGGPEAHRHRQLQHQVRPGKQGRPGPHLPGEYRRLAPLNIQPTHETYHCRLWVLLPEKGQLPGMAQMKGIVFANNAHCPHRRDPPVFFKNFQRKTCRSGENEIKYP